MAQRFLRSTRAVPPSSRSPPAARGAREEEDDLEDEDDEYAVDSDEVDDEEEEELSLPSSRHDTKLASESFFQFPPRVDRMSIVLISAWSPLICSYGWTIATNFHVMSRDFLLAASFGAASSAVALLCTAYCVQPQIRTRVVKTLDRWVDRGLDSLDSPYAPFIVLGGLLVIFRGPF